MNTNYLLILENDTNLRSQFTTSFSGQNTSVEFVSGSGDIMLFLNRKLIENQALPKMIIVNLKSTPHNGLFILQEVKGSHFFSHIPVIITGSDVNDEMIRKCYSEGASSFLNLSTHENVNAKKLEIFLAYWLEAVELNGPAFVPAEGK